MPENNEIVILKLGGSLITDKEIPQSVREDDIVRLIQEIKEAGKKIILVHGGGSFGHPIAKKYSISQGTNNSIVNQLSGFSKTHDAMIKLNSILVDHFLQKKYPIISIQPSAIFKKENDEIILISPDTIEASLKTGILPILYGDVILDTRGSFSILSGDDIILELCRNLRKFRVSKVIFGVEIEGIYIEILEDQKKSVRLAKELDDDDLFRINLANLGGKIDVTGGMKAKFEIIKKIVELGIPVQLVNGLKSGYLLKALTGQAIESTIIKPSSKSEIHKRKFDHLKIPLEQDVQHSENYFQYIKLIHHPLPEISLEEIDISTRFFNKKISAPICIAAITGGPLLSKAINCILASVAEEEKIIMGVGSQRIALEDPTTIDSFKVVREVAPTIPIIGNIGIGQINLETFSVEDFLECINMIKADVMAIHFNALHELVQINSDHSYTNFYTKFKQIREQVRIPIIAKEVGSGFNSESAKLLEDLGFDGFDIGGAGGTSFAAIESYRNNNNSNERTRDQANLFKEWGIPTPVSILNVRNVSEKPIIATGGLKNGMDIAKSIILGADIGGFAFKFLKSAWKDNNNQNLHQTSKEIKTLKDELRSTMWLMNVKNIQQLKGNISKRVFLGRLYEWLNQPSN